MHKTLKLIGWVIGCELVGIIGSIFTVSAIPTWYALLNKPWFAPPNWLFGPVWTALYAGMGVAGYLLWELAQNKKKAKIARKFFAAQLLLNFIWTPVFFGLRSPELGLCVILPMWLAIVLTIRSSYLVSRTAACLLIPYLAWVSFASLLNGALALLN